MNEINLKHSFNYDYFDETSRALHVRNTILPFLGQLLLSQEKEDFHLSELCIEFFNEDKFLNDNKFNEKMSIGYYRLWHKFCKNNFPMDFDDITRNDLQLNRETGNEIMWCITPFLKNKTFLLHIMSKMTNYVKDVKEHIRITRHRRKCPPVDDVQTNKKRKM